MLVVLLSLGGAELLSSKKQIGLQIGADVALAKARAVSEAILAGDDAQTATFTSQRLAGALADDAPLPLDEFAARAVTALRKDATRPQAKFGELNGTYHLRYATTDGAGGVLMLDLPIAAE